MPDVKKHLAIITAIALCCLSSSCTHTRLRPAPSDNPLIKPLDAAIAKGLDYLAANANGKDGSFGTRAPGENGKETYKPDTGITGLVVAAAAKSPFAEYEKEQPYFKRAVEFLVANIRKDGSIVEEGKEYSNYKTAIALTALGALGEPGEYGKTISDAQDFIRSRQFNENRNVTREMWRYGGIGYGGRVGRPDLSNTQWAVEALRETGVGAEDPLFKKVVVFLKRCQNESGGNDYDGKQAGLIRINDGGARYSPIESKVRVTVPGGKYKLPSYGSMTYAFLKSMIYAGVDRDDPRVQAAFRWIVRNYSLDANPGFSGEKNAGRQGLFYYYHTMSKALLVMGESTLRTDDGKTHDWARELSRKIISLQREDGSWKNECSERWFEGNPSLVTAYGILALNNCRRALSTQIENAKSPGRRSCGALCAGLSRQPRSNHYDS